MPERHLPIPDPVLRALWRGVELYVFVVLIVKDRKVPAWNSLPAARPVGAGRATDRGTATATPATAVAHALTPAVARATAPAVARTTTTPAAARRTDPVAAARATAPAANAAARSRGELTLT